MEMGLYSSEERVQEAAQALALLVNLTLEKEASGPLN
jgi:hypothetical protein